MATPAGVILALSQTPRPVPLDRPAHLVPLANRPLLVHVLRALHDAGLRHAAVVVDGATAAPTRAVAGDGSAFGIAIDYLEQEQDAEPAGALAAAFDRVGDAPCIVHHGRAFFGGSLGPLVTDFSRRRADCVVLVGGEPGATNGSTRARGRMLGMCERRAGGERIVPLGIDLCRPAVLDRLRTCAPQGATLSEALVDLAADGRAEAWAVRAPAVRLDSCDAVLEASRLALDAVESDWGRADVADTRIEGRVVIASTAVVRSSVIRGPALIGPGAHVEHAYVGPYTVIGDRSRVECAELENSVLLADVTISSPGWRLEASILGARARVTRGFDLPAAVRLRLGDGALVHTT